MRRAIWVFITIIICLALMGIMPGRSLALNQNVAAKSVGKVYVGKNSYVEFLEPHLVQWGKNNVLSFKVRLFNGGQSTIDLLRYGITVATNAGGTSNALRQEDEETSTKVLPQLAKDYAFYTVVPNMTVLTGVRFGVKEWNINYPGFSKTIGTLKMPVKYTDSVPAGDGKITLVQSNQIRLSARDFYTYEMANKQMYTVTFSAESWGTQPVKLPDYSFWLQTETGELYPLEAGKDAELELKPKAKKVYDLNAALPKSVNARSFKLLAGSKEEDVNLITDVFVLQTAKSWDKLMAAKQTAYYIRPDEDQFSISAKPIYITETDLPQMTAGMEITLKNNGKHAANKPELAYFIEANQITYLMTDDEPDDSGALGALEQSTIFASAEIPRALKTYGMNLIVAKVLGDTDNPVYKPLLKLPLDKSEDTELTKADTITKTASKDGTSYTLDLSNVLGYVEGNKRVIQGTLTLVNTGEKSIKLPDYRVTGVAGQKYKYEGGFQGETQSDPLTPKSRIKKVFQIELPQNVDLAGFKVLVEEPVQQDDDKLYRPVATFILPNLQNTLLAGSEWVYFSSGLGEFKVKRTSTMRLPVNGEDALVTEFELYSSGYEAASLPEFKASYYVNHTIVEADAIILDKVISASPDHPVSLQIVGKIPYSMSGGDMTVLLEQSENNLSQSIAQFAIPTMGSLHSYAANDTYTLDITGRESELQLYQVLVYPGTADDLIEIEMIQRNQNKRSTASNPITGYLQSEDGIYYPLEYENGSGTTVKYGGAAVQTLSGKVPKGTKPENLKLLMGLAVNKQGIADSGGNAEAYVKPALYSLMEENKNKDNGLTGMIAGPYTLSMSNVMAKLTSTYSGALEFNAVLTRAIAFDDFDEKHKIVIRLENGGEVITQREYGLNTDDTNSFTMVDRKFQMDGIPTSFTSPLVQVKVYLSYKGELRLIGSQNAALPQLPK